MTTKISFEMLNNEKNKNIIYKPSEKILKLINDIDVKLETIFYELNKVKNNEEKEAVKTDVVFESNDLFNAEEKLYFVSEYHMRGFKNSIMLEQDIIDPYEANRPPMPYDEDYSPKKLMPKRGTLIMIK